MKMAYLLQVHKERDQIIHLVELLNPNINPILIHVDRKSDELYRSLREYFSNRSGVWIVENRIDVHWSGFSQVEATLSMMKTLRSEKISYDYIHLLSGEDMPIKSDKYIKNYLLECDRKIYLDVEPIGNLSWRLDIYNFFTELTYNRAYPIRIFDKISRMMQGGWIKRTSPNGWKYYKGSQWFSFPCETVSYILDFIEENRNWLYHRFRWTACPDEHFFQILLMNSHFSDKVEGNNLRFIRWGDTSNSPSILLEKDESEIFSSSALFARKFDWRKSRKLINKITRKLKNEEE